MEKPMVQLCEYNPEWALRFEFEKKNISGVIGEKIIGIEHIGSTSIVGLGAKPIIDILVGIKRMEEAETLIHPLSTVEYEYVPKTELVDRRFFRKGLWGQGTCHLHVCEFNSIEWKEKLCFRDYLRKHPEAVETYYLLKKELAAKYEFDRPSYTKKKEPFIRMIIEKANRRDIIE